MKPIVILSICTLVFSSISSCATQNTSPSASVTAMLQKEEFIFVAERANPTNFDVINVINSLPSGSAGRILNLDAGYTIEVNKQQLVVTLPYFGRLYRANMDPDKNSYRFTSKDFTISSVSGKKGSTVLIFNFKDQPNVQKLILEIYKNGRAYVSIDSNDRQTISYDGYVMAVPEPGVKK